MKIDRTSALLASLALLAGACAVARPTPARNAVAGAAVLALVSYDRWHDGLWPFTDRRRQVAGGFA